MYRKFTDEEYSQLSTLHESIMVFNAQFQEYERFVNYNYDLYSSRHPYEMGFRNCCTVTKDMIDDYVQNVNAFWSYVGSWARDNQDNNPVQRSAKYYENVVLTYLINYGSEYYENMLNKEAKEFIERLPPQIVQMIIKKENELDGYIRRLKLDLDSCLISRITDIVDTMFFFINCFQRTDEQNNKEIL